MRNLFISLPLLAFAVTSQAADSIDVTVMGTLYANTVCDVTSGGVVDLGDIITSKIDGTAYTKDLGVSLTCTNRNIVQSVGVTITGAGTKTNKLPITGVAKGFELALKRNNVDQNFDTLIPVAVDGSLNLSIVPVKTADAFVEGPFSAVVTVKVDIS